jgi:hypothetical protein
VPDAERALRQTDPVLAAVLTDQADVDRVGDRRRHREPNPAGLGMCPERKRPAGVHVLGMIGAHPSILPAALSE